MYNTISALALIELLYYCGEQQLSPDQRFSCNNVIPFSFSRP